MDFVNFPIVALGAALVCLIGVGIYAIMQRGSIRSRDEQLVVARAQAYAMLELSQAGVLFLDREHKIMGEASAAAPELLGHTCATGTAFVQVIAELVDVKLRRETVAYLDALWQAPSTAMVDATQNPLQRVHAGSRHLAIRFARLVVDERVHHVIVAIERIAAPRVVPHTIEVPILNEETFAKRLAGETGSRPALNVEAIQAASIAAEAVEPMPAPAPVGKPGEKPRELDAFLAASQPAAIAAVPVAAAPPATSAAVSAEPMTTGQFELGPLDITEDSLPSIRAQRIATLSMSLPTNLRDPSAAATTLPANAEPVQLAATTVTSSAAPSAALEKTLEPAPPQPKRDPDPNSIIDPPDARLSEVLKEIMHVDAARLGQFLSEARDKAGQLRAILKLPAREPQAFREKLVLILELIRGIHARAERLPLPSVCERARRFEEALGKLRDKQILSGNDFLPLAVKLDDLLSHLAIQGEVVTRLTQWREQNGAPAPSIEATQRSVTATHTTIRQPNLSATQRAARLSDLSQESLSEMAQFLSDMYSKRVSLVVVGLEDVPQHYRRTVEKLLGQLIHNAIRHGLETPADRAVGDKPEIGTVAVQFARAGADGYQLSVQDDGRGLDHDRIRAEAVRQGVLTADAAATIDPRKLASLIFRPGFTTVGEGGARGIGMDMVRELVNKAGGRVGIATKPGEYTRFRITLPHEKKNADAAVA